MVVCSRGTTWAPVGQTRVVGNTGKHIKVNIISAVTWAGALRSAVYPDTFTPRCSSTSARTSTSGWCTTPTKTSLIVDGHPVYRASAVKDFVAGTHGRLRLFPVSCRGTVLSSTRRVGLGNVKHDRIGLAGLDDAGGLAAKTRSAMHRLQKLPEVVRASSETRTWPTSPRNRPARHQPDDQIRKTTPAAATAGRSSHPATRQHQRSAMAMNSASTQQMMKIAVYRLTHSPVGVPRFVQRPAAFDAAIYN